MDVPEWQKYQVLKNPEATYKLVGRTFQLEQNKSPRIGICCSIY